MGELKRSDWRGGVLRRSEREWRQSRALPPTHALPRERPAHAKAYITPPPRVHVSPTLPAPAASSTTTTNENDLTVHSYPKPKALMFSNGVQQIRTTSNVSGAETTSSPTSALRESEKVKIRSQYEAVNYLEGLSQTLKDDMRLPAILTRNYVLSIVERSCEDALKKRMFSVTFRKVEEPFTKVTYLLDVSKCVSKIVMYCHTPCPVSLAEQHW